MLNWFKDIPKPIWIFTAIWFVLGLIQAALMDLHPDEAYYWQMSRFMDWGYFHQPPMIAVFIKIGYALFQNELGVRLITVPASSLGILMLYKLSKTQSPKTFILIFLGLILTHAGVFMAVPDSPLIFFTLVFLVLLREYLIEDKLITAIGLGIVAAALMYSKYHAIVLFASVIVAVPRLLLRKSFWLTALVGVLLFIPHIIWQFEHDLVSFKFHWVVREKKVWDIMVLLDYLAGQLIMLGPVGLILIVSLVKSKAKSDFDRMLNAIVVGFFGFFFILALRGKVEANWTATAFLPLIILGSRNIPNQEKLNRILKPTAVVCASILILARIYIASPWAGDGIKVNFPLKGWPVWANAIRDKADGKPVFFSGTYQLASQYSFYSGEQGYHFSPLNYNGNQFELWSMDSIVEGRPFVLVFGMGQDSSKMVHVDGFKPMFVYPQNEYHSYRNLRFEFPEKSLEAISGSTIELRGTLVNRTSRNLNLDELLVERPLKVFYYLNGTQSPSKEILCNGCSGIINPQESKPVSFTVQIPKEPGKYFIRFGLDFALGMPEHNSDFIQLKVTRN
ncbi:MAG: glycosyltransferase family 39 protein [Flavobacteriales bacterium]|nr:glycosyltransferase family 39 protein [Flavobacteriales bacterium]